MEPRKLLTFTEVKKAMGGISRCSLCRLIEEGKFPPPLPITTQGKVWLELDVVWYVHGLELATRFEKNLSQPVPTPTQPVPSDRGVLDKPRTRG